MNYIENYYSNYDEEARFGYKHGQIEFLTTMRYIEKYLNGDAYVLEIGAATGRYSRAIADMGYRVEAVELVPHNIGIFETLITPGQKIKITQGNAMDLSMFADNSFDITLVLGPMYHLYSENDKQQAISEALRVTKPGGVIFVAYCISEGTMYEEGFIRKSAWFPVFLTNGKIDPVTFGTTSLPEDIFELVRKEDIDRLMTHFEVERLHYVATDMISRIIRESLANMDDELFNVYLKYHYAICERPDMVGLTHHSLDIFRKI